MKTVATHRLRAVLISDAAIELVLGGLLLTLPSVVARWLAIAPAVAIAAGVVFLAAAAAVGLIAYRSAERREIVRMLAFGNIAGGAIGWVVLLVAWGALAAPGRALVGSASDVFIALGAMELIYLRKGSVSSAA